MTKVEIILLQAFLLCYFFFFKLFFFFQVLWSFPTHREPVVKLLESFGDVSWSTSMWNVQVIYRGLSCRLRAVPYTGVSHALAAQKWEELLKWMKRSLTPIHSRLAARCCRSGKKNKIHRLERDHQRGETIADARGCTDFYMSNISLQWHFCSLEVGGRLQFVMLKYERTEPGRVKAHGRGLSVYSGL